MKDRGIEGVAWSAQRIPAAVNLSFQDRSRYFFFQVAPQLSSRGLELTSSTSGGRSVGIVRLRTKSHGVFFFSMKDPRFSQRWL
jgi:hypothetical protein